MPERIEEYDFNPRREAEDLTPFLDGGIYRFRIPEEALLIQALRQALIRQATPLGLKVRMNVEGDPPTAAVMQAYRPESPRPESAVGNIVRDNVVRR